MPARVIYDIGANSGQDLDYYLLKADRVIAVEANPQLCAGLRSRFAVAIDDGRLVVENVALTAGAEPSVVDFFVHRSDHQLSQFPEPMDNPADFDAIRVPSMPVTDLIARHGAPWYLKTDIEYYDAPLLRGLFASGIRPPYVSAEYHGFDVLATLVACGGYDAFKLVQQEQVPVDFASHPIATLDGQSVRYAFSLHATGPFGPDLPGPWHRAETFFRQIALQNLDWADIHATSVEAPLEEPPPGARALFGAHLRRRWNRLAR